MRRFLSAWLVLLVIGAFTLAMLVTVPLMTRAAQRSARADLDQLLDAGGALLDEAQEDARAVAAGAESNLLAKSRAIARLLAHDDELLQTDALLTLCELVDVAAVDVTDYAGVVVASSASGRIGRDLMSESGASWMREVLDGDSVERTHADSTESALLWGCVPRTDTDGFLLVQSLDRSILTAKALSDPATVLRGLSFIRDGLFVDAESGEPGMRIEGDALFVRRLHTLPDDAGTLTLAASRSLNQVYLVRNAVVLVLVILLLIGIALALLLQALLRHRGRAHIAFDAPLHARPIAEGAADTPPDGANTVLADAPASTRDALPPAQDLPDCESGVPVDVSMPQDVPASCDAPILQKKNRRASKRAAKAPRVKKPRQKLFEFVTEEPASDLEAPDAQAFASDERLCPDAQDLPQRDYAAPADVSLPQDRPDSGNAPVSRKKSRRAAELAAKTIAQDRPDADGATPADASLPQDLPDNDDDAPIFAAENAPRMRDPSRRTRRTQSGGRRKPADDSADDLFDQIFDG